MKIPVRYNHVGYTPDAAKIFFVNLQELESANEGPESYKFRIVRRLQCDDASAVWEGSLVEGSFEHHGACEYTGETLWSGDFSSVLSLLKIWIEKKG